MGSAAKMQKSSDLKRVIARLSEGYVGEQKVSKKMRPRIAQLAALSAALYYTSRRVSDVLDMRWSDFIERDSTKTDIQFKDVLYILEGKTGKYMTIKIHEDLKKYLAKHYRYSRFQPDVSSHVFKSINGKRLHRTNVFVKLKETFEAFGVENVSPHGFRKSAARRMYEDLGRNHEALVTVQKILNHSDVTTTLTYIGIDVDRMNKAFDLL